MPKEGTRRYTVEIKDANGNTVWFGAADWDDVDRRVTIAQLSRLCGMPDENPFTKGPTEPPAKN